MLNNLTIEEQEKFKNMLLERMYVEQNQKITKFKELNKTILAGGIVFIGDSITDFYPIQELFSSKYLIYNRGISGFTSVQLLQNLDTLVFDLNPNKVVILIGTNDIERAGDAKSVGKNIQQICVRILQKNSATRIYVLSVYPINNSKQYKEGIESRTNEEIVQINKEIEKHISELNTVQYIDIYNDLLDDNHNLHLSFTTDGLHLSIEGYHFVTNKIKEFL